MKTISTLFSKVSALIHRYFSRPTPPTASATTGNQHHGHYSQATQSGPPPAADMFMPSQAFTHQIDFGEAPRGGSVRSRSEQWSRDGNSLRCDTNTTMVETCSGLIVPASQLKAICKVTGKYAEEFERCFRCGQTICMLHCRGLSTPDGVFFFCEDCLKQELRHWNTWVEVDGKLEVRQPPRPFCPASGSSVHGRVSHETNETGGI